jgi:protein-S-isoprenylcysteine O-methyltransferase Ste14
MRTFFVLLVPALWIAWLAVWLIAALRTKQTARRESIGSRLAYTVLFVAGGFMLGKPQFLGPALEQRVHPHTFGWYLVGLALLLAGLGFTIVARVWLGRNWSGTVTLKEDHELIRSGPYALVRHPIYTGLLIALIGTAIVVGRWRALVGLVPFLAGLLLKMRKEEQFMTEAFGEQYARYRDEVPALVPYLF